MPEDEYFSKEEMEDEDMEDEDIERQEEEDEDEKLKEEFTEIQNLINERNRIKDELKVKQKYHQDRIGLLTYDIFGHPDQKYKTGFDALIDRVKKILSDGHMRRHPITAEMNKLIDLFERLQQEHIELNLCYETTIKNQGKIGDNSINMNIEKQKLIRTLELKSKQKKPEVKIDKEMVEDFMEERGQDWIDEYIEAVYAKDLPGQNKAKGAYVQSASLYFKQHSNPRKFGNDLFDYYAQKAKKARKKALKKKDENFNDSSDNESKQPQYSAILTKSPTDIRGLSETGEDPDIDKIV